jgi:hypothetical protein
MERFILAFVLLSSLACSSQPGAENGGPEGAPAESRASLDACTGQFGTEGDDVVCGSGGNDTLIGGPGDDVLYGFTVVVSPGVDEIALGEFYAGYAHAYGVEEVEFSDVTVWNRAYLLAHASQVGG